jgi:hypothetical protein
MDIMNSTRIYVTGNPEDGYKVTFDYGKKSLDFWAHSHAFAVSHIESMQRTGEIGEFFLFDTSEKSLK